MTPAAVKTPRLPAGLKPEMVPVADLKPLARNARRGDIDFIRASIRQHGQYLPIIARRETGEILKGNHTFLAAQAEGHTHIAVIWRSVPSDQDAQRFALADNRASDLATYDVLELAATLREIDDIAGTGYDQKALDQIIKDADRILDAQRDAVNDPETPEPPKKPTTRPGDRIILGDSVLVCGDATSIPDLKLALAGEQAALLFTDPPYGVSYRDNGSGASGQNARLRQQGVKIHRRFEAIEGDDLRDQDLHDFLLAAFTAAYQVTRPDAAAYVWHASSTAAIFEQALEAAGYLIRAQIVWAKTRPAFNMAQYKYQHEPAFYAFKRGETVAWHGDRSQTTLWQVPQDDSRSYEHPTQKPARLASPAIVNSSRPGELVLDPFAGSGSTLLCATQLDRRAAAIEISPAYCDVIIARWEALTGQTAQRPTRKPRPTRKKAQP